MTKSNPYDPPATHARLVKEQQPLGFFERVSVYLKLIHVTGDWVAVMTALLTAAFVALVALAILFRYTEIDEIVEHWVKSWYT